MSFVFYTDTPQYKPRGIKVDLQYKRKAKFNISWGVQPDYNPHLPVTTKHKQKSYMGKFASKDLKVMEHEDNEEELDRLIRKFKGGKAPNGINQQSKLRTSESRQEYNIPLMQSELIRGKRDHVGLLMDQSLLNNRSFNMQESRVSRRSSTGNKKNQSFVQLGDGHNPFMPEIYREKTLDQRLKQMYQYQESLRRRKQKNGSLY